MVAYYPDFCQLSVLCSVMRGVAVSNMSVTDAQIESHVLVVYYQLHLSHGRIFLSVCAQVIHSSKVSPFHSETKTGLFAAPI